MYTTSSLLSDCSAFVASNQWLPESWLNTEDLRGTQLKQENVINLNAVSIVLLLVPFSYLVARMKVLWAMALGFVIAIGGVIVTGTSQSVYIV